MELTMTSKKLNKYKKKTKSLKINKCTNKSVRGKR